MRIIFKIYFLIFFLSGKSFCQIRIDEIKNDSDVIQFIQNYSDKHNLGWKNMGLDISQAYPKKYFNKNQIEFTDSVTKTKWIKCDFNGDGRNDLIYNGRIYFSQMAVLAFISEDADSISLHYLGNVLSGSRPSSISHLKDGDNELLEIGIFGKRNMPEDYIKSYEKDILIYKYGGFVEYNKRKFKKIEFDSIVYRISSPWGIFDSPTKLWLYRNGTIKLYQEYNQVNHSLVFVKNTYVSKISKNEVDEIASLLGYINFYNLKRDYSLYMVSDQATVKLEIFFYGNEMEINDYGMCGTFGLSLLYSKLGEIMKRNKLGNR